ncbi:MAG: YesL family protein [Lachnospiraceae bacterium]|nr:YesL family protein [Lachnospiraceae bacterium]
MNKFFNMDNPVFVFLGRVADLIFLNFLAIICSLPIFTIGASWTALYYTTVKMVKKEESYIAKDFFKSFRLNFKQATGIWLVNLLVLLVFLLDLDIIFDPEMSIPKVVMVIIFAVMFIAVSIMICIYPLLSRYTNTVKGTVKNAALVALANPGKVLLFVLFIGLPHLYIYMLMYGFEELMRAFPFYLMLGYSGPAYLCSLFWKKIFNKLEGNNPESASEQEGVPEGITEDVDEDINADIDEAISEDINEENTAETAEEGATVIYSEQNSKDQT